MITLNTSSMTFASLNHARPRLATWSMLLAAAIGLASPALGHQMPPGCIAINPNMYLQIDRTGIAQEAPFSQGQELRFSVRLDNSGCNFEGGQMGIQLPNGEFIHIAGYADAQPMPMVQQGMSFVPATQAIYTISNADAVPHVSLPMGGLPLTVYYGPIGNHPEQSGPIVHSGIFNTSFSLMATNVLPICPADVAPAIGDGIVGIDDLLGVISAWGTTGMHRADVNGDSIVAIDDLLGVISAWGQCH